MKSRYIYIIIASLLVLAVTVAVLLTVASINAQPIIKTAVKKRNLPKNETFVICELVPVTGFDWKIISTNEINKKDTWCTIVGPTPLDLNLEIDFLTSSNSYVFYVANVREYYSIEIDGTAIEYTVTGWDILYPVRRESMLTFLKTPKYILESDLNSHAGGG